METHRCSICYTWRANPGTCNQVTCIACGAEQCSSNGTARGTCRHCYYGRLPGWSFSRHSATCQYAKCSDPAVYAYMPGRNKDVCKAHGDRILGRTR